MKLNVTPWSKRLTALLLVLFMVVSMIPMTALAAEPPTDPPVAEAVASFRLAQPAQTRIKPGLFKNLKTIKHLYNHT